MQIYKAHINRQSVGAAVLSKTGASSLTDGTRGKYVQSHVGGEVGRSTDAVQQQWMNDRPDLCELLEPHTWRLASEQLACKCYIWVPLLLWLYHCMFVQSKSCCVVEADEASHAGNIPGLVVHRCGGYLVIHCLPANIRCAFFSLQTFAGRLTRHICLNCHAHNWGQFIFRYRNGCIIIIIAVVAVFHGTVGVCQIPQVQYLLKQASRHVIPHYFYVPKPR